MHHPLPPFYRINPQTCTTPSLLPCGRRGTACGGGWRTRWLIRVPHTLAPILALHCLSMARYVAVSCQSAGPASYHPPLTRSPLFQRKRAFLRCTALPINCALRCTVLPISRTRRLSPTASAIPPLSGKEGFCVVLCQSSPFLNLVPYFYLWSTTSNKRF